MDNLNRRVPEDPQKININQSWEVEYWTKKLHISEKKTTHPSSKGWS